MLIVSSPECGPQKAGKVEDTSQRGELAHQQPTLIKDLGLDASGVS